MPNENQTTEPTPSLGATCSASGLPKSDQSVVIGSSATPECERNERFTVDEIAEYLAGWTLGPWDEVEKLGAHVLHNALHQLRDEQDGIVAVRERRRRYPQNH